MSLRVVERNIGRRMRGRRGIAAAIGCEGVGLHSGTTARLRFVPAEPRSGIVLHRTDIGAVIPARHDHVIQTRLCTMIGDPARPDATVSTIEHVMAAAAGLGIDDLLVEIDGPEMPILDGSAGEFAFLLRCAGIVETDGPANAIEILRPVRVADGPASAELLPSDSDDLGFPMALAIDFPDAAIGKQAISLELDDENFCSELARARTFTRVSDIEAARDAGLARGGSLANAIVVDGERILNQEGLRWKDEFVRHKLLDVVGDLALAGAPIIGRFLGARTGHRLNNFLLRTLFSDPANYRMINLAPAPALAAVA